MYFFLSKALWFFLKPSNLLFTGVAGGGILTVLGAKRVGRWLVFLSLAAIFTLAIVPVGTMMTRTLENRFPVVVDDNLPDGIDGIIVLGGVIDPLVSQERKQLSVGSAIERFLVVPRLAERYPGVPIVLTGGSGQLFHQDAKEGDYFRQLAAILHLDPTRLVIESQSRNTVENATLSKRLVPVRPGRRWLLVTSAFHMPRSVGVFRRQGWPVLAYPVDFSTRPTGDLPLTFDVLSGLYHFDAAVHEYLGLLIYRVTGRTASLFPAPKP